MSLLGFDALGRLALGQTRQGGTSIVMPAVAGAFTFSSAPATFKITETASAGAFTFSGKAASLNIGEAAAPGSFTLSLKTATFGRTMSAAVGAFTFTGIDPDEALSEDADPGAFVFSGKAAALTRTGYDYEAGHQGIGHYLEERERARRLAAITKKIPGVPIDRRTSPQWEPLRARPQRRSRRRSIWRRSRLSAWPRLRLRLRRQQSAASGMKRRCYFLLAERGYPGAVGNSRISARGGSSAFSEPAEPAEGKQR